MRRRHRNDQAGPLPATVHPVSSATPCSVTTASTSTRAVVTTPPRRVELIVDSPRDSERSAMTERAPVSDAARLKST